MNNNIKDLSEELIKSIHRMEGFTSPNIEEELVHNLLERLDELTSEDKEERIKALRNMFALGQNFSEKQKVMNKEQQSLIDEAYENYYTFMRDDRQQELDKEEFINKCKTNPEFSEKWGLTIEERELSLEERAQWLQDNAEWDLLVGNLDHDHIREVVEEEAPNKLIIVTYQDQTIESYE